MPDFVYCLLEEIDQYGKSAREDIINKYTLDNSRLILDDCRGRIAEVYLEDIVAIEQNGIYGISIKTMTSTMLLKSNGQASGDASLIDLKIKLLEFAKRSLLERSKPGREQCRMGDNSDTETIEAVIGRGDDRHDFYTMEAKAEYIRGVSWENFGELLVHKHDTSEQTLIESVYAKEDQILSKGERIMRLAENRGKDGIKIIDIIYGGDDKICIHRIAAEGLEVGEQTEAMVFFLIQDSPEELVKVGGAGVIRMPIPKAPTRRHPFIEIKWKADVGSIIEEGETVCIVEIDNREKSLGEIKITAPCRLCVSSPRCNLDTERSVMMGGILMEYLHLPDKEIVDRKSGGKPRRERRRAAKISERIEKDHDYESGLDLRWTRRLSLDTNEDIASIEVVKWYCGINSQVSNGQAIIQVQEKRKNEEIVWYDVYYEGDTPVWIYSTKCKDHVGRKQILDATGEICSVYLDIQQDVPPPAEGEFGYIRMPFVDDEMQLISLVRWKAAAGEIYEKGEKICELTVLDWGSNPIGDHVIFAPYKLQISSIDFDSGKTVYANGILLEYMRLCEMTQEAKNDGQHTTYRNKGQGRKEIIDGAPIKRSTGYRNQGAGSCEILGVSPIEKQANAEEHGSSKSGRDSKTIDIQEHIFWTDNTAFFYGKISEWKTGRGNGFYAKNDIVCELKCFTPDIRAPFTENIRATCDMIVTERLTVQGQQIPNNCPLFRYVPHSSQSSHQKPATQSNSASSSSALNNQITEPIEGLDTFIQMVRDGYAFQVRDVLERIVNTERERIENERLLWRLGAGAVTLVSFGLIDGFGLNDLLSGFAMSNVAGMAHQVASKEQVEFLKKLQSEWLVLDRSPIDIRRRLGEPQGRFIGISRANILDMFNIHQSGSRGYHMVELDHAGKIAKGFKDAQSLEVLQRAYDEEDIGIISSQLYPSKITPLKLCRTITPEEAKNKDPYYNQLSKAGAPFRVVYSDNTEGVMYRIPIPHHSDY